MKELLKRHGMKITPQRLELVRTLEELGEAHPSFNQVYKLVKAKHPSVSRSTVYNNLKLLAELGVINAFNYKGETHYEVNPTPHINLIGSDGTIKDVKGVEIESHLKEILRLVEEKTGIKIKNLMVLAE